MGILFTTHMGFLFTITLGILFTISMQSGKMLRITDFPILLPTGDLIYPR